MQILKTPLFKYPLITKDNFIFLLTTSISSTISYFLFGHETLDISILSVIITFFIHNSKPNNGDYIYTLLWVGIALLGLFIGYKFGIHWYFYIFLAITAIYYNFTYTQDLPGAKAFPYIVVFSALGSFMPKGTFEAFLYPTIIGTSLALLTIWILNRQKLDFKGFINGILSKNSYSKPEKTLFITIIIYIVFLFLTFYIPQVLGLERGYWSAFAFIFLISPQIKNLTTNTLYRFGGTILGALICVGINGMIGNNTIFLLIPLGLTVFFYLSIIRSPNAIVRIAGITLLILLLIEYSFFFDDIDTKLPWIRILETLIGGVLATIGGLLIHFVQTYQMNKVQTN